MARFRGILERLRALLTRDRMDGEMEEEFGFHLEMETKKNLEKGMSPAEARRQALIAFGGVERFKERTREETGVRPLEDLLSDLRFAFRTLRKSPGFTLVAILSLAIGIGANTAIFSIVNALLVRDVPYEDADQLVNVYRARARGSFDPLNYPDFLELQEATGEVFSELGGYQYVLAQRETGQGVETLVAELITGNYFALLGVDPALGRTLLPEDHQTPGAHPVVVLGFRYWQRSFGGDPGVLGQSISLSGRAYTIVGVAPENFSGSLRGVAPHFFAPVMMVGDLMPLDGNALESRGWNSFFPVGRLQPGTNMAQVRGALSQVSTHLFTTYPDVWQVGDSLQAAATASVLFNPSQDEAVASANYLAMGVVALVLLIACANLISFLLARAVDRRKEVALRLALGARRERLVRQLLTEALALAVLGGVAGLLLAMWVLGAAENVSLPAPLSIGLDLSLDRTVLAFSLAVTLGTGILVGLVPAIQATRPDVAPTLKDEGTGSHGPKVLALGRFLVSGQVAVSVVLLVTAGLFIRSFDASRTLDPGFGQAPTALLSFMVPSQDYSADEGLVLLESIREGIGAIPGVEDVGAISNIHMNPVNNMSLDVSVEGMPPPGGRSAHVVDFTSVDEGFFRAAGIPLLEGRVFGREDSPNDLPVAVVNQAMARQFWPEGQALGRTIRVDLNDWPDVTVVGIVGTAKIHSLGEAPTPFIYLPFTQEYNAWVTVMAVTRGDPASTSREMYRWLREAHPDVIVTSSKTMDQHVGFQLLPRRVSALLSGLFAAIAVGLAVMGLFGVVNYAVSRRAKELGIRMSLGASPESLVSLQLKDGMKLVVLGGGVGLVLAVLATRALSGFLLGVSTWDPLTFFVVILVMTSVGLVAGYIPARKARRANPMGVLRQD